MYKFLRIYDVKRNGNEVVSAKYKVISEFEKFHYDIRTSEKLISICREKNLPDINSGNMYSVVKYEIIFQLQMKHSSFTTQIVK